MGQSKLEDLLKTSLAYYRQLQNRVEDAIRFLNEGRVTHHPSEHAILYKMKLLEDAGVRVKIVGNDARVRGSKKAPFNEVSPEWNPERMPDIPWGWPMTPLK